MAVDEEDDAMVFELCVLTAAVVAREDVSVGGHTAVEIVASVFSFWGKLEAEGTTSMVGRVSQAI